MVAAVDVRVTQESSLGAVGGKADLRLTQGAVLIATETIAADVRGTQGTILASISGKPDLRTTQGAILAVWTGRTDNRKLRAWGYSLDGHDFYVLRLGISSTLVFDLTTNQWAVWESPGLPYWVAHLGLNWQGVAATSLNKGHAWDIIGGDDTTGDLWMVDPTYSLDHNVDGVETEFSRQAIGALPMRLRQTAQCAAVYLLGSLGAPALTGDTVILETSDDQGVNWLSHGAVTVTTGTSQELSWMGLGLVTSPGRLFRITDSGALGRISSLDMRP